MSLTYTALGAAGEVTGSQHLLEHRSFRILLDCGLFQGGASAHADNRRLDCHPGDLDAVVLSHAHADHCGRLPMLVREGFDGEIYCTPATARIAAIMLKDSAGIQEEDAAFCRKRFGPDHPGARPLYTEDDAKKAIKLFQPIAYNEPTRLNPHLKLTFREAGHILGSAITELSIGKAPNHTRLVFTGDLGRRGMPLLKDPATLSGCDVLLSECTYGDKTHTPPGDLAKELLRILDRAALHGGRVVIPAFSLGRTQQVVYYLNELAEAGVLPEMPVYVDSPLATRLTEIYRDRDDLMDEEAQAILTLDDDLFDFDGLLYTVKRQDSIAINQVGPPFVVISASGMCDAGRVRHHLLRALPNENDCVALIGYQGRGTTGRAISERRAFVETFDRRVPIRCHIEQFGGLSAHAGADDLKWWFEAMADEGG
ncbi:MAG: MBL fold metallo-hydrolase, partial [Planctomycetota bacterium]